MSFLQQDTNTKALTPGAVSVTPVGVPVAGPAVVWTTLTGFTGVPVVSASAPTQYGSVVTVSCNVAGMTLAPGSNTATLSVPVAPIAVTFSRVGQAFGGAAGARTSDGLSMSGTVASAAGSATLTLTMTNTLGAAFTPDFGIQVMLTYKLV